MRAYVRDQRLAGLCVAGILLSAICSNAQVPPGNRQFYQPNPSREEYVKVRLRFSDDRLLPSVRSIQDGLASRLRCIAN